VGLDREDNGAWRVGIEDVDTLERHAVSSKFVFIGAGGATIELLQRSRIPEGHGYGGFPVSGIWLRCDESAVSDRHHAKVYGKAAQGSPPMSVPHLDTRIIEGKKSLLFGPYAGFSSRFLKHGSLTDLFESVTPGNIVPLLAVARDNIALTEYLIGQVFQSSAHQFATLRQFFPKAARKDWREAVAGQRVQIIKPDEQRGGVLEFGTELVAAENKSLVALLGASPGASNRSLHRSRRARKVLCERAHRERLAPQAKGDHSDIRDRSRPGRRRLPQDPRRYCGHLEGREYLIRTPSTSLVTEAGALNYAI
jgi:malate dehydrogenase (quinone)